MLMRHPAAPQDYEPGICYFSVSESKASTSSTTQNVDKRIGASDQAQVISLADGSQLSLTDPGLLDALGETGAQFESALEKALAFASKQNDQTNALTQEVLQSAKTEQAQFFDNLLKYGTAAVVAVVVAINAPRFVKG